MKRRTNIGVSSVFGSVLILLLVVTLASALFTSLYSFEEKAQESIDFEEERTQEKISLLSLSTENISGTEYLVAISVNNTGTITTRIRAVYIDKNFVCDPTNPVLNVNDTYINPKDSLWIIIPNNLKYEPLSQIEVATERGMKSIEYEWKLKSGSQAEPPPETQRFHFGPLLLDFEKFYYTENYGSYDQNSWKPGWSVEKGITLVWNVTVTNIDDRDITINKYSGFTMVSNDGGVQLPWFIEPPDGLDTLFIEANSTAHLIYVWDRPRMTQGVKNQSVYNQNDRSKVFLTFFGIFHEHDGSTKPYGQTIPFEAVLVRDPQMEITAAPNVIAASSLLRSTITVTVRDVMGLLAPGVTVNFATTLGAISSSTAVTNPSGVATVTLTPGSTTGTATVTAAWGGVSKSTTVTIAPGILSLSANPATLAASSTQTSTVTARVTLNGNPIPGETVSFTTTIGAVNPTTAVTNAQGYATVILTPGAQTGTATITANWGTLTQTTPIIIASGTLTLTAAPSTLAANSTMTSKITARVTLNGNALSGETVMFSTSLGTVSPTTIVTNSSGYATVTFTPGAATGTATITANWATLSSSTPILITSGELSLSTIPDTIAAGSTMTSAITARVTLNGNPLQGETVTFSATSSLGVLSSNSALTNAQGYATVTFTPGTDTGIVPITADWGILSQSTSITVSSGDLTLLANNPIVAAGSAMNSVITARVTVNGSPLSGETVTFSATPVLGLLSSATATTNSEGYVFITFTPGINIGTTIITADWGTQSRSLPITIILGELSLSTSVEVIAAGSTMNSIITGNVILNGSPIVGETVTFTTDATPSQGLLSSYTAITNNFGDAVVTFFPGTGTGIVAITAEWGTLTQPVSLTIATGTVAVQANPTAINATLIETAEIEVTVLLNGGPVINGAVTLGTNSSQVNLSATAVSTDAFGKVRVTLTPGSVAEYVEVIATWEGITGSTIINIVGVSP